MKKEDGDFWFKFYVDKYISGTMGYTIEMHGAYLLSLFYQFNNGHATEEQLNRLTGNRFDLIREKFAQDEDGKFYNIKMEENILERKKISEIKSTNRKGKTKDNQKKNICNSNDELTGSLLMDNGLDFIFKVIGEKFPSLTSGVGVINSLIFSALNELLEQSAPFRDEPAWNTYLDKIEKSDYLMGRGNWIKSTPINLHWICKSENCMKTMAGDYDNRTKDNSNNDAAEAWDKFFKCLLSAPRGKLWQTVDDEKIKATIKAIGGEEKIRNSNEQRELPFLKKQFIGEYNRA